MLRFALGLLLLSCNVAHAQLTSSGVATVFETSGGYSIPDPNNRLILISLAKNASVQRAMGLTAEQAKLLGEAFQANDGSFSSISWSGGLPADSAAMQREFKAIRAQRAQLLDELISPDQWEQLRKIAYQVEIARVGLGKAITEGRLGFDVGVHENQKTHLLEKVAQLEIDTFTQIYQVRVDSQKELLAELPDELKTKIEALIGKPFPFRENSAEERQLHRELVRKFRLGMAPDKMTDPQQRLQVSLLLLNASVRQETKFGESQLAALVEAGELNSKDAFESRLGEIVAEEQWTRLRQLCYQIEIARLGIKDAISRGRLGQDLQVDADTRKLLIDKAAEIEARAGKTIVNILQRAQDLLLAELSAEQRTKAKELLSEPFYLTDDNYWRYAR